MTGAQNHRLFAPLPCSIGILAAESMRTTRADTAPAALGLEWKLAEICDMLPVSIGRVFTSREHRALALEIRALEDRLDDLSILFVSVYGPQSELVTRTKAVYSAVKLLEAELSCQACLDSATCG